MPNSNNYFARHWRGELSLPRSYWINGVLLFGLGCNLVIVVAATITIVLLRQVPALAAFVLIGELAVNITCYVWALVGTWRSAGKYNGPRVWSILARLAMSFGVILTLSRLAQDLKVIEMILNQR